MKTSLEIFKEIWRTQRDSIINIIALVLAIAYLDIVWLKILLILFVIYILFTIINNVRIFYTEKHVPLAVIVYGEEQTRNSFINACIRPLGKRQFDEKNLSTIEIGRDDWLTCYPYDLPADPQQWKQIVILFRNKLNYIKTKLKGRQYFHVFLKCRTALAFALGAVLGTWHNVIIYQEQGENELNPVIYIDNKIKRAGHYYYHAIKSKPDTPYKFIEIIQPNIFSSPTLVSLHLAGHSPYPYVMAEAKKRGLSYFLVNNCYNNTITDKDWFPIAQEVASALLDLLKHTMEIEIYASCPNAIALAIGMALGDQCPASIFHKFNNESDYKFVVKLNDLK